MSSGSSSQPGGSVANEQNRPQTGESPVQVVVVQQNPAESEKTTVGKFVETLLSGKKEDNNAGGSPDRNLTVSLARSPLLLLVIVFLLAGGIQVADIVLRYRESKQPPPPVQRDDLRDIVAFALTSLEVRSVANEAQDAATAAKGAANAAQQASLAAQQATLVTARAGTTNSTQVAGRLDPALEGWLLALAKSPSPPSTTLVPYPLAIPPGPSPAVSSAVATTNTGGAVQQGLAIRPAFDLTPCLQDGDTANDSKECKKTISGWGRKVGTTSPVQAIVQLKNGPVDLDLIDVEGFLDKSPHPGPQDLAGICPYPSASYGLWKANTPSEQKLLLQMRPYWNSAERKQALKQWQEGPVLFLTLCTTVRIPGSVAVLNRTVYQIDVREDTATLSTIDPYEEQTIVRQ